MKNKLAELLKKRQEKKEQKIKGEYDQALELAKWFKEIRDSSNLYGKED